MQPQLMLEALGVVDERFEFFGRVGKEHAIRGEITIGEADQGHRAVAAGAEAVLALFAVAEIDLRCRRLEAALEREFAAAFVFQMAEGELDVFAGAQAVGLKIAAGAGIVAEVLTADDDLVKKLSACASRTENSERIASSPWFWISNAWVRPCSRRSPICQSSSDMFSGRFVRESLAGFCAATGPI